MSGLRVMVLSDTHMRPSIDRDLPEEVWRAAEDADVILHAGDIVTNELLARLESFAPTHAVLGNNDLTLRGLLPETLELVLGGVKLAMIHDSGPTKGRAARMGRRFPAAAVVVYGHSHMPDDSLAPSGQILFNPGSPTERRRAPTKTFGWLEFGDGEILNHRIVSI